MFSKVLARYYHQWLRDCYDSAMYCKERGDEANATAYLQSAAKYFDIIINNWEAIEFFSIGENASKKDSALPEEFRGY